MARVHATAPSPEDLPLPDVPSQTRARDGQIIETASDRWVGHAAADGGRQIVLNWELLEEDRAAWRLPQWDRILLRLFVIDRMRRRSVRDGANAFQQLRFALRWFVSHLDRDGDMVFTWAGLQYGEMLALLRAGDDTAVRGTYFNRLRHFYRWGVEQGFPGFDAQTLAKLELHRAQGNLKGHRVSSRDPEQGPVSAAEGALITNAVLDGRGTPEDRAIVMLCRELGVNPLAVVRVRNRHLRRYQAKSSTDPSRMVTRYQLEVHRVKKRRVLIEMRTRPISNRLGDLLWALKTGGEGARLLHWLPANNPEQGMYASLKRWARAARLISPRTKAPLHLFARRFRYGLGTGLSDEGYSASYIKDALDHTDYQNVSVYINASPRVVDHIESRLDPVLAPVVDRFLGAVIARPANPPRGRTVPGTAVEIPEMPLDVGGIGLCGRDPGLDGLCGRGGVLGCYMCPHFQAFVEGPHALVLVRLEKASSRMVKAGENGLAGQVSPCVSAVRQLLAQIERRRQQSENR